MFRLLSNQHYQHRTNQKQRSWANAVFQNRGVCGQAFPSFPSFFLLSSQLSRRTRGETLVTQAMDLTFNLSFVKMTAVKRVKVNNGNFNTCLSAATFFQRGQTAKTQAVQLTKKVFSLFLGETFDLRKPPLEYWGQNVFEQHSCQFDLHLVYVHITCTTLAVFYKQFSSNKIYLKNSG